MTRTRNLFQAQLSANSDEMNDEQVEQEKRIVNQNCRLQIVNSYLVKKGDYEIGSRTYTQRNFQIHLK